MKIDIFDTTKLVKLDFDETDEQLFSDPLGHCIQNYDILNELDTQEGYLNTMLGTSTGIMAFAAAFPPAALLILPGVIGLERAFEYKIIIQRLRSVTKTLLENFGDRGIQITLRVKTDKALIDLFVKMPDRRFFALMLRSNGEGSARWREEKQKFFLHKTGKKSQKWDAMTLTAKQLKSVLHLKDLKSPLVGNTVADRRRQVIKTIVLCNKTKIHPDNLSQYWADFGRIKANDHQALKIQDDGVFYVVEEKNLIDFLLMPEKLVISGKKGNNRTV